MKRCPRCGQTYTDRDINFCLNDGELLSHLVQSPAADDSPPTLMMDPARITNQTNWGVHSPPAPYQPPSHPYQAGGVGMMGFPRSADQTMPTIALGLGIGSLLFVCCYGGIWLGIPAAVVGFIGIRNADKDPARYGGRGLAIGGMVIGIVSLLLSIVFILFALFTS